MKNSILILCIVLFSSNAYCELTTGDTTPDAINYITIPETDIEYFTYGPILGETNTEDQIPVDQEETIIIQFGNDTFQVWKGDKVLSVIGKDIEWLSKRHGTMSYTKLDSLKEAKEAIENLGPAVVNSFIYEGHLVDSDSISNISNEIRIKEGFKKMFIIEVLGANLVILFIVIFWTIISFFTMKNFFNWEYEQIKNGSLDMEYQFKALFLSLFFPIFYIWKAITLSFYILIHHVLKNLFKILDKVIPKIKLEKDE